MIIAVQTIGTGLSGFLFNWLAGWLYTNEGPTSIFYLATSGGISFGVVAVCMQILASRHGSRHNLAKQRTMDVIPEREGTDSVGSSVTILLTTGQSEVTKL